MHSYETLVILALALSTASPALSAPVRDQHQARANVDEHGTRSLASLGKTVLLNGALGAAIPTLEHFLGGDSGSGGDSTRRDGLPSNLDRRAPAGISGVLDDVVKSLDSSDSFGKVIVDNLANGVAAGATAFGVNKLLNPSSRDEVDNLASQPTFSPIFNDPSKGSSPGEILHNIYEGQFKNGYLPGRALSSPGDILHNIYADQFKNGYLPGRALSMRDPSPVDVNQIFGDVEDVIKTLGGVAQSFLPRDDALARGLIEDFQRLKDFGSDLEHTIH